MHGLWKLLIMLSSWSTDALNIAATDPPPAVKLGGELYLRLDAMAGLMGGTVAFTEPSLPLGIQPLTVTIGAERWQFPNGGDRLLVVSRKEDVPLAHPVLLYLGSYYASAREMAPFFGYEVRTEGGLQVTTASRSLKLDPIPIDSAYHVHRVEDLRAVHRPIRTTGLLRVRPSLHRPGDLREIPKGTNLLVRRSAVVDGIPSMVLTDCGPEYRSYLADVRDVDAGTESATLAGTGWEVTRRWFDGAVEAESGVRRGDRGTLAKTACLTIDLCWSLRPFEPDVLAILRAAADGTGRPVAPVLFLTGRWMQQHPGELHNLIELGQKSGVEATWGLHSFDHPKYGKFLNDYPRERLMADDIRQEKLMLEWGIVPSVYYRFPGLIHDRQRLRAILDLDLFPIDCDSWSAIVEERKAKPDKGPFGHPITDGSIILIHGNGNEPAGIPPLRRWLGDHPDWKLNSIHMFMPSGK